MNELALFAGGGGGILGSHLLGWKTVCAVEIEKYPREILFQRQRDGILPLFPIWDDIKTFDGRSWKGKIDIVTGGFPCQDISAAGKGAGLDGKRSGLYSEMLRVADEVGAEFIYMENSSMLTSRGLGIILRDLAEMGYNARWCVLGADDARAPHRRKRIWILAYSNNQRKLQSERNEQKQRGRIGNSNKEMAYTDGTRLQRPDVRETEHEAKNGLSSKCSKIAWWDIDPADISNTNRERLQACGKSRSNGIPPKKQENNSQQIESRSNGTKSNRYGAQSQLGRVAHGVAKRVDRLKAIGNGQVPAVAALAFIILSEGLI